MPGQPLISLTETLLQLEELGPGRLEAILGNRSGVNAQALMQEVKGILRFEVELEISYEAETTTTTTAVCDVKRTSEWREGATGISILLLVGFRDGKMLLCKRIHGSNDSRRFTIAVPKSSRRQELVAHIMNKDFVGRDSSASVSIDPVPGSKPEPRPREAAVPAKTMALAKPEQNHEAAKGPGLGPSRPRSTLNETSKAGSGRLGPPTSGPAAARLERVYGSGGAGGSQTYGSGGGQAQSVPPTPSTVRKPLYQVWPLALAW